MKSKALKPYYNNRNISSKLKEGKTLLIDEMFYSIQTEGPFSGHPAYFIRLWGCNLSCAFCDTPQKNNKPTKMKVKDVVAKVNKESTSPMVVITGGEPFMYRLDRLVEGLLAAEFWIQFETNGTLPPKGFKIGENGVHAVVSPKTKAIDKYLAERAMAFKYVVSNKNMDYRDGLPKDLYRPETVNNKIMLSPMFGSTEKETKENIKLAINISKQFGYWFTFQWHKLIGIR